MKRVSLGEIALVFVWSVAIMAATAVPYHAAERLAGPHRDFCGFIWGVDDGNVYLSWVRQAAEGRVLLRNQYTVKDQSPRFLNVFLLALGRVCAITGLSVRAAFTGSRYVCGVFCLMAFYALMGGLTSSRSARFLGLALASVSSGLGWVVVLAGQNGGLLPGLAAFPMDVADGWQAQPEAIIFSSLLLNPLFALALGLVSLTMLQVARLVCAPCYAPAIWTGILLLILGNVHGYDIFPVHATLLLWLGCSCLTGRLKARRATVQYGIILAISAAAPVWAYFGAKGDPSYAAKVNTATLSPRPFDVAVGYGLVLALAMWGAWIMCNAGPATRRRNRGLLLAALTLGALGFMVQQLGAPMSLLSVFVFALPVLAVFALVGRRDASEAQWRALLPVLWAACGAAVLYLPAPFQRKMMEGLHLPLCALGGIALAAIVGSRRDATSRVPGGNGGRGTGPRPTNGDGGRADATSPVPTGTPRRQALGYPVRVALVAAVLLATAPSNVTFVSECLHHVQANNRTLLQVLAPPVFLSRGEVEAMDWLGRNTSERDVVLSSSLTGNYIPAHAPCLVVVGHWAETLDFSGYLRVAAQFYDPRSSEEAREAIISLGAPTYIWWGPQERLLQGDEARDPCADLEGLRLAYENPEVRIYAPRRQEQVLHG